MLLGYDIGLNGLGVIALCRRRVAFQQPNTYEADSQISL